MRVYSMVRPKRLSEMPDAIARAEKLGYDGTTLLETDRAADPLCNCGRGGDEQGQPDDRRLCRVSAQPDGNRL